MDFARLQTKPLSCREAFQPADEFFRTDSRFVRNMLAGEAHD